MPSPGRILAPLCVLASLLHLAAVDPRIEPVALLRSGFAGVPLWAAPTAAVLLAAALLAAARLGARVERAVRALPEGLSPLQRPAFRRRSAGVAVEAAIAWGLLAGLAAGGLVALLVAAVRGELDGRSLVLLGRTLGKTWLLPQAVAAAVLFVDLWCVRRPLLAARRGLLLWSMFVLLCCGGFVALRLGAFDGVLVAQLLASVDSVENGLRQRLADAHEAERAGDVELAIQRYQAAIDRNPARQRRHRFFPALQEARCGLSRCLARAGHKQRALAMAKAVVDDEPEWYVGHRERARVQRTFGDVKGSEASLRRALQLCPAEPEALAMLVDELTIAGKSRDVVEVCRAQLSTFQLAELSCEANGVATRRNFGMDGEWHQLELPVTGAGYRVTLQCRLGGADVPLWVEGVGTSDRPRLAEPSALAADAHADVVATVLEGGGRTRVELQGELAPGQRFVRLRYLAVPSLGDEVLAALRLAATGTVHPK